MSLKTAQLIPTLGADPEIMVVEAATGKVVSAIPLMRGHNKEKPVDLGDGIKMYYDNVLMEFAFPPSYGRGALVTKLRTAFHRGQQHIGKDYRFLPKAAHVYDMEQLSDKVSWEAGCSPNFDAYAETMNLPAEFKNGLRSGSFHIHIGSDDWKNKNAYRSDKLLNSKSKHQAIRLLDMYVGVASVIFDKDETAQSRRALYGRAGEFRPTPYGIEYRVLGNYALRSPELTANVLDLVEHVLDVIRSGEEEEMMALVDAKDVREVINTGNKKGAEDLLKQAKLPDKLYKMIHKDIKPDFYRDWCI